MDEVVDIARYGLRCSSDARRRLLALIPVYCFANLFSKPINLVTDAFRDLVVRSSTGFRELPMFKVVVLVELEREQNRDRLARQPAPRISAGQAVRLHPRNSSRTRKLERASLPLQKYQECHYSQPRSIQDRVWVF